MAEFVDIPTNVLAAGTIVFGAATGALGYLWKGKQKEVDVAKAETEAARAETRATQAKYEDLLKSMVASEPQRKEALDNMARALADNTALLRERTRQ